MSSIYTSTTAALKAVTVDSCIIKSNKVLIKKKTDNGDYVDILNEVDTINGRLEEIDSTISTAALTDKENVFTYQNDFSAGLSSSNITIGQNTTIDSTGIQSDNLIITNNISLQQSREQSSLKEHDVLSCSESDERYANLNNDNEFTGNNVFDGDSTFTSAVQLDAPITTNNSINVLGGNIYISKGSQISFLDDGEVTITSGASGYPIYNGIPSIVSNGVIYNIGTLTDDVDLSDITFDGDETLVQSCEIWFTVGATAYDITWPDNAYWIDYEDGTIPSLFTNMKYRIVLRKEIDDIVASISHYYAVR